MNRLDDTLNAMRLSAVVVSEQDLHAAWQDGFTAGAAAQPAADVHVPVPVRWRVVRPGDVIVGEDGELYMVTAVLVAPRGVELRLTHGKYDERHWGDPDQVANVLMRVELKDALVLTRDQLGARLMGTREGS